MSYHFGSKDTQLFLGLINLQHLHERQKVELHLHISLSLHRASPCSSWESAKQRFCLLFNPESGSKWWHSQANLYCCGLNAIFCSLSSISTTKLSVLALIRVPLKPFVTSSSLSFSRNSSLSNTQRTSDLIQP